MPGQQTFPKRERLTKSSDFLDVFKHGKKMVGPVFVCYVLRRKGQGRKLGFAVSRKVGGAVTRNRVKRYIREIYRVNRQHLVDDFSVVVVARPACAALDYPQCSEALTALFRRGALLSE